MKLRLLILTLMISQLAIAAEEDVSKWSLRYLARSSNALLVAADQVFENKKIMCQMKKNEVSKASRNLQYFIDLKIPKLTTKEIDEIRQQAAQCSAECTCDIYAYFFEKSKDPKDKKMLARMSSQAEKVDGPARIKCSQNFKEFCSSKLLVRLKK